jgi:hypothetical protein
MAIASTVILFSYNRRTDSQTEQGGLTVTLQVCIRQISALFLRLDSSFDVRYITQSLRVKVDITF